MNIYTHTHKHRPVWKLIKTKKKKKKRLSTFEIGAAGMENSMVVPQKTKKRVAIWSWNPTPGHRSRQNYNSKRYMHRNVHSSTIYNSQDMETALNVYQQMNG